MAVENFVSEPSLKPAATSTNRQPAGVYHWSLYIFLAAAISWYTIAISLPRAIEGACVTFGRIHQSRGTSHSASLHIWYRAHGNNLFLFSLRLGITLCPENLIVFFFLGFKRLRYCFISQV